MATTSKNIMLRSLKLKTQIKNLEVEGPQVFCLQLKQLSNLVIKLKKSLVKHLLLKLTRMFMIAIRENLKKDQNYLGIP